MQCPTSPKEPFDAGLLSLKLESYRQELKLEKARHQMAVKKAVSREELSSSLPGSATKLSFVLPSEEKKTTSTVSDPANDSSGVQRSKSLNASQILNVPEKPERKRSLIHRRTNPQEEPKDGSPSAPYVPRCAAKQFKSTTTPAKEKQKGEMKSTAVKEEQKSETNPVPLKKPRSPKHKLDWEEPIPKATAAPVVMAETPTDATARRAALLSIHNTAVNPRQRPLSTALDNLRICELEQNPYILSSSLRQPQDTQHEEVSAASQFQQRPHLKSDRHDWSQASQCGDSARVSLHLRRKDIASENAEIAGLRPGKNKRRQKSHGDAPDGMVNEAVRLIREEKKKHSIFGVFRRH